MNLVDELRKLKDQGLTFGECVHVFADPEDDPYLVAAQDKVREGEIEVDIPGIVSRGADDGAYVMAWMWVENSEAGIGPAEDDEEDIHENDSGSR